jgi:hypothetical protein
MGIPSAFRGDATHVDPAMAPRIGDEILADPHVDSSVDVVSVTTRV